MKLIPLIGALFLSAAPVKAVEASEDLNNEELGKMLEYIPLDTSQGLLITHA